MSRLLLIFSLCIFSIRSFAQIAEDNLSFADSLSIFLLIDSLLAMDDLRSSQLVARIGYNSNVLSAGRTLGIENFGLSPGLSYYHHSGLYADAAAYWSSDFSPSLYLTVLSAGYLMEVSKSVSITVNYDRYWYQNDDGDAYIPYRNTLSFTPTLDYKTLFASLNYSFYFGDTYVHRLMPGVGFKLEAKSKKKPIKFLLQPSAYVLFGNETTIEITYPPLRDAIRLIRQGKPAYIQTEKNVFGIMNYTFSAPLSVSAYQWLFTLSYNYNIPVSLPGEPLTLSESSFLSGSVCYFFDVSSKK